MENCGIELNWITWWRLVKLDERFDVDINLTNEFNADVIIDELLESFSINRGILSSIKQN